MKAFNTRNGKQLADNVTVADSLFTRMKGLLGKADIKTGEALWIRPCTSIQTFFMRFPIDVVFLNKRKQVVAFKRNVQPNRLTPIYLSAVSVLKLPIGTIDASNTETGDTIDIA